MNLVHSGIASISTEDELVCRWLSGIRALRTSGAAKLIADCKKEGDDGRRHILTAIGVNDHVR